VPYQQAGRKAVTVYKLQLQILPAVLYWRGALLIKCGPGKRARERGCAERTEKKLYNEDINNQSSSRDIITG
jgi:hypothetical protein